MRDPARVLGSASRQRDLSDIANERPAKRRLRRETTIADLLAHGDFGLGTFNELDGEMIAFSSQVYQLRADGSARAAKPEQKTPFAVMTWFQPQYRKASTGRSAVSRSTT